MTATAPALSDYALAALEPLVTQYTKGEEPARELTIHEIAALSADACRMRKQGENWMEFHRDHTDAEVCRAWLEACDDYCRERGYY